MSKLKKHLEENLKDIPKHFVRKLIAQKLADQGIENSSLLSALTEHISSGSSEDFHWDDGEPDITKKLSISFTDEDGHRIEKEVSAFLKDGLPKVIENTLRESAKSFVRSLDRRWPEQKVEERGDMRHFRDRLELRWGKGLDALHMLLISSREIGQNYAEKLSRSRAKSGRIKRQALVILHMRACQTTLEIVTLLGNGLADGAFARWRTLYEISVVAFLIDKFGDSVAEQYLAHEVVSLRETVINEFKHAGITYDEKNLRGEIKDLQDEFEAATDAYGRSFAGPYGWAASCLNLKSPRFQDLEEAIGWKALPPNYKASSHRIHAGIVGAVRSLSTIGGQPFIHAGASNAGLETPASNTAYSLLHVTSLLFGKSSDLEVQIQMQALVILRDRVVRECGKAAKTLEKDELEIRSGLSEL
ncbi:DUF5677 domain-containing protein [Gemmobacter denitrificans]|uniref:DUF5677 domain-containing protein n=1 Tax=Gemmobacter denitrificans TaxID=3123040 RepID=A0ABU8BX36_9RHOB